MSAQAVGFSGAIRVDRRGVPRIVQAFGLADRAYRIANTADTQFGTASATKGLIALTAMALVEQGRLDLVTTARSLLDEDLPEIAEDQIPGGTIESKAEPEPDELRPVTSPKPAGQWYWRHRSYGTFGLRRSPHGAAWPLRGAGRC